MLRLLLLLVISSYLVSCASLSSKPEEDEGDNGLNYQVLQAQAIQKVEALDDEANEHQGRTELAKAPVPEKPKYIPPKYEMIPQKTNAKVEKWIEYYSVKDRERFQRFLSRGAKYKEIVQSLLIVNGLPPDLYYLGILESGYVTDAVSHAGAVGPWQFMRPTGRQYGLKINSYIDERLDPIRSTLAAARYLKELYRIKKSWYLALAAYNAGPGRVRQAMRRGGTRSFWSLSRRRLLPYDTREYIPQFLAILTIGQDPEKYGFHEEPNKMFPQVELVKVPSPISLEHVANMGGLSLEKLSTLNPHLIKGHTPPSVKSYSLWVPKKRAARVKEQYATLEPLRIKGLKPARFIASRSHRYHRVRRGQTLSGIARHYGTTVKKIKRLNGLKGSQVLVGQKLKVRGKVTKTRKVVARYHKVRRGENLTAIAQRYGTSVSHIKSINRLKTSRLYVGQKIKLRGQPKALKKRYRIRSGDSLIKIAKRFGTTVQKLKSINQLKGNKLLRGQYIYVARN
ncbi:MAG: LysM peptidoglycan-binding domain-containing protein [Bdellovibrionales bacterium]|nr:LysM peptidoglycan-binding domain-containing protein [Bdellovibrionales bacterium]